MRMPEIMAEAFARGLLDKIMLEVLNVIDDDTHDGKSWEQRVDEETSDGQSELVHGRSQEHVRKLNYSKAEEMELIAQIVRDLRDIQIGDSCYVLSPTLLALEKQVKYAACNIDDAPHVNREAEVVKTRATQGQGDTHQIVHTAILESLTEQTESVGTARKEKESEAAREATNVSIGLLHQLIEELENKSVLAKGSKNIASSTSTGKEHIATWEEKEEQLIRIIERPGNLLETTETLRASESAGCFHDVELKSHEGELASELKSRSSQHVASTSKETCLQLERYDSSPLSPSKSWRDNAALMEEILTMEDIETRKASGEATLTTATKKKKKKKSLSGRLRKFFRAAFGRKN